jgi:hypothetical protein
MGRDTSRREEIAIKKTTTKSNLIWLSKDLIITDPKRLKYYQKISTIG